MGVIPLSAQFTMICVKCVRHCRLGSNYILRVAIESGGLSIQ